MKPRRRLLLLLLPLLLLGGLLLVPSVRWRLVGWVKGEAFYRGRPTSFWSELLVADFAANSPASSPLIDRDFPCGWLQAAGLFTRSSSFSPFDLVGTPECIPVCRELLDEKHPPLVRAYAAYSLRDAESETETILPVLIELLRDDDWWVQQWARNGLMRMGSRAKAAAPMLRELQVCDHGVYINNQVSIRRVLIAITGEDK